VTYHLMFRIRRQYFDAIVAGTKTVEYRRKSPFWDQRVNRVLSDKAKYLVLNPHLGRSVSVTLDLSEVASEKIVGVFVCGPRTHRRIVTGIGLQFTESMNFSRQGRRDVDTPECYSFHLGEVVNPDSETDA